MATEFKVKLRLVDKKSGEVVSYKQDGERFGQAVTVKLTTDTEYEISVSTRPAIIIEYKYCHLYLIYLSALIKQFKNMKK
jgi:hypothetical protein